MTCSTERGNPRSPRIFLIACVAALGAMSLSSPALADAADAERLYEEGKAALDTKDYPKALELFKTVLRGADTDEGTKWQMMLAIAVTYRSMEEMGHAIEYYKRFLSRSEEFRATLDTKRLNRRSLVEVEGVWLERGRRRAMRKQRTSSPKGKP